MEKAANRYGKWALRYSSRTATARPMAAWLKQASFACTQTILIFAEIALLHSNCYAMARCAAICMACLI